MARARNLKPGFFTNELLVELPYEYRLLFAGLWCVADREGRMEDRAKRIKMELFPADAIDVEAGLQALAASGFIQRYEADGKRYVQVLQFQKHQNPHHREAQSTIPVPSKPGASPRLAIAKDDAKALGQPEASPSQAPTKASASRADSLIPDALIPEQEQQGGSADADPHPRTERIPFQAIADAYNHAMTRLPKVRDLTAKRRTMIRTAWQESPRRQSVDFWQAYFEECAADPFRNGVGPYRGEHANWRPDFDFLIRSDQVQRLVEQAIDRGERAA